MIKQNVLKLLNVYSAVLKHIMCVETSRFSYLRGAVHQATHQHNYKFQNNVESTLVTLLSLATPLTRI